MIEKSDAIETILLELLYLNNGETHERLHTELLSMGLLFACVWISVENDRWLLTNDSFEDLPKI